MVRSHRETCRVTPYSTWKTKIQPSMTIEIFSIWCHVKCFEDNEAVIKMIIKGRSPTIRHVSRSHRVALDWLFDGIVLYPKIPSKVHRHQTSSRRHIDQKVIIWHVMSGTIFFICSTSAISTIFAALRISAWLAAPKWRRGCNIKQKKKGLWQHQSPQSSSSVNHPIASKCPGDTQSINRESWREGKKKFKTQRSVEFSRKAERCIPLAGWWLNQKEVTGKLVASKKFRKFRAFQSWKQKMAT